MPKKNQTTHHSSSFPEIEDAEHIVRGQGAFIHILESNRLGSRGFYELAPDGSVERTRLPLEEKLTQIEGESIVTVYEEEQGPIVHHLSHGSELCILPGKDHIHVNQSGRLSLTKWEFEGDATALIDAWRREARRREVGNDK